MSAIDPNTPRNAPCPCGSGKKFKRCHGAEAAAEAAAGPVESDGKVRTAFIVAILISIAVGVGFEPETGLACAAASVIGIGAWAIFRNPPPPKSGGDDPAAINFGG